MTAPEPRPKARRGFAAMSPEKQREIASLGGKAAQANGNAHRWTGEDAAAAGRKGGSASQASRRTATPETCPACDYERRTGKAAQSAHDCDPANQGRVA